MAINFNAQQYEKEFKPARIGNWEIPKAYKGKVSSSLNFFDTIIKNTNILTCKFRTLKHYLDSLNLLQTIKDISSLESPGHRRILGELSLALGTCRVKFQARLRLTV